MTPSLPVISCTRPRPAILGLQMQLLSIAFLMIQTVHSAEPAIPAIKLASPGNALSVTLDTSDSGRPVWALQREDRWLVRPSPLGITVNGVDLGAGVTAGQPIIHEVREQYAWRGVKQQATNHCRVVLVPFHHGASDTRWILEGRLFDDGFAYRYHVPGLGQRTVQGESSSWNLVEGSRAWFQTNTSDYEGVYQSSLVEDFPQPVHLGPPVTVELPKDGYLLLTEANLVRYSGMTLRPTGNSRLEAVFQDDPAGFVLSGDIRSPWRVTIAVPDLHSLVNTDVIYNLAEPPDPKLFPEGARTEWIRPGKALITWCVFGNEGARWHLQKWFVDQCAALRCEYLLVDAGWRTERWGWLADGGDVWQRLKELCDYAASRNVGIVVWHAFPEGRDDGPGLTQAAARRDLFRRCQEAGVQGVKIDFFNSESLSILEAYDDLTRLAAEHRLHINFHGANKPTGEVRTWPNEITREGIREQEYLLWDLLPLEHYAALPFTRMVVGHSDFLPTYVRAKYLKNTTAAFQMATAIIASTSFLCWPDHPYDYLVSPFLGLIQNLPLVWDETRVLPGSEIGRLAAFARRSGDTWYLGVLNGTDQDVAWECSLDFLGQSQVHATLYRDRPPDRTGVDTETGRLLTAQDTLQAKLAPGGGFVAWLKPRQSP
jgi:alpha-glucosidase